MSLTIQAFTEALPVRIGPPDAAFEAAQRDVLEVSLVYLRPHASFPARADGLSAGYYRVTLPPDGDMLNLSATQWNAFRNTLCRMVTGKGIDAVWFGEITSPAFMGIFDFGDDAGLLGPVQVQTLAGDFAAWASRASAFAAALTSSPPGTTVAAWRGVWRNLYRDVGAIFDAATPRGVVRFS
jgi:hypothetical protein